MRPAFDIVEGNATTLLEPGARAVMVTVVLVFLFFLPFFFPIFSCGGGFASA
jgi:hypothetical protein